ncbi:glycosyltransferase family 2 protein [Arthrobacter sp. SA17]
MVSHNGGGYLPRTLAALTQQTRPVDAFIGVDTGSRDDSAALLEEAFGQANVVSFTGAKSGMGGAIRAGLAAKSPWNPQSETVNEWIWLLHDDAAPILAPLPSCCTPSNVRPR